MSHLHTITQYPIWDQPQHQKDIKSQIHSFILISLFSMRLKSRVFRVLETTWLYNWRFRSSSLDYRCVSGVLYFNIGFNVSGRYPLQDVYPAFLGIPPTEYVPNISRFINHRICPACVACVSRYTPPQYMSSMCSMCVQVYPPQNMYPAFLGTSTTGYVQHFTWYYQWWDLFFC